MKISHLLEDTRENLFEQLMRGKFYQQNILPILQEHQGSGFEQIWMEIHRSRTILFHGTSESNLKQFSFRYRSKSRDTNAYVHEMVNKLSVEKFGEPIRNLMFVSTSESVANGYGTAMVVVPLGDYKLYYHPHASDFTVNMHAASEKSSTVSEDSTILYLLNAVQNGRYSDTYDNFFRKAGGDNDKPRAFVTTFNKSFFYLGHIKYEKNEEVTLSGLKEYMKNMIEHDGLDVDVSDDEKLTVMATFVLDLFTELAGKYDINITRYVDGVKELINEKVTVPQVEIMCHPGEFVLMPQSVFKEFIYYAHQNDSKVN